MSHKIYRPILRASEIADNVRTAVRHNSTIGVPYMSRCSIAQHFWRDSSMSATGQRKIDHWRRISTATSTIDQLAIETLAWRHAVCRSISRVQLPSLPPFSRRRRPFSDVGPSSVTFDFTYESHSHDDVRLTAPAVYAAFSFQNFVKLLTVNGKNI